MNNPYQSPQENEICQVWLKDQDNGYIVCIYQSDQFHEFGQGSIGRVVSKNLIKKWRHLGFP